MRINSKNLLYALQHPRRAFRYLRYRDVIPYSTIARYIPKDPVILEAGAANGVNTLEMAEYWPLCRIHAFEPVPAAREALLKRTASCRERVDVYPFALGEQPGSFPMFVSGDGDADDSQSSSLLAPSLHAAEFDFVKFGRRISVAVNTIDRWTEEQKIKQVDFLWLDMQGYELCALRGAEAILPGVQAIHIEVSNVALYEGAPLAPEVYRFMATKGFKPVVEALFRISGNVLFAR
jgi:FkbM family methyltransferase